MKIICERRDGARDKQKHQCSYRGNIIMIQGVDINSITSEQLSQVSESGSTAHLPF
jgi:hypothetical protein